jgi:hypothetical protein
MPSFRNIHTAYTLDRDHAIWIDSCRIDGQLYAVMASTVSCVQTKLGVQMMKRRIAVDSFI